MNEKVRRQNTKQALKVQVTPLWMTNTIITMITAAGRRAGGRKISSSEVD